MGLRYFPLVCVLRHLRHHLFCELASAQYLRVLVMSWLQATRGMEVALLQVTTYHIQTYNPRIVHIDF